MQKLIIDSFLQYRSPDDTNGIVHFEGSQKRLEGDELPATYVNLYMSNKTVIVPGFDDPKFDAMAVDSLKQIFPERQVLQIQTREIILGGGNIHCITQHQPKCGLVPFSQFS